MPTLRIFGLRGIGIPGLLCGGDRTKYTNAVLPPTAPAGVSSFWNKINDGVAVVEGLASPRSSRDDLTACLSFCLCIHAVSIHPAICS
jgi:hypothetical protein